VSQAGSWARASRNVLDWLHAVVVPFQGMPRWLKSAKRQSFILCLPPQCHPHQSLLWTGPVRAHRACSSHRGAPHIWAAPSHSRQLPPDLSGLSLLLICIHPSQHPNHVSCPYMPQLFFPPSGMKRCPGGLQLLLSVSEAEAIGACLGCSTSAVAHLGWEQTGKKKPATKCPKPCVCKGFASEQRHAGGGGRWQCKGEMSYPPRQQDNFFQGQEKVLLSAVSLQPWRPEVEWKLIWGRRRWCWNCPWVWTSCDPGTLWKSLTWSTTVWSSK